MRYTRRRSTFSSGFFPPGVKWLLITNVAVYLLNFFAMLLLDRDPFRAFGLVPYQVLRGYIWQPFTYMFLHGNTWHIIFNMLALWFFGPTLERDWGTKRFLQYYFLCGVGAAICVITAGYFANEEMLRTIGASGALFGVLLAYGVLYPNATVLYDFLFPIKAKYFVMIVGAIAFIGSLSRGGGISHVAHLGGMLFGYVFLKTRARRKTVGRSSVSSLRDRYQQWKIQRARKKFQVYLRRHGNDTDRWVQ